MSICPFCEQPSCICPIYPPPNAERPGTGCPCDPFGSDGLQCPGPDGRPLCCTPASAASVGAEKALTDAGVFKGSHGLRGLADAQSFWDEQPYGTRLYYGPGITDYLHRGVLRTAVELLASRPAPAVTPVGPGAWYPLDILGNPMREHSPGKWESCVWPSAAPEAAVSVGVTDAEVEAFAEILWPYRHEAYIRSNYAAHLHFALTSFLNARLRASGQEGAG